jgi:hypothetical protein
LRSPLLKFFEKNQSPLFRHTFLVTFMNRFNTYEDQQASGEVDNEPYGPSEEEKEVFRKSARTYAFKGMLDTIHRLCFDFCTDFSGPPTASSINCFLSCADRFIEGRNFAIEGYLSYAGYL